MQKPLKMLYNTFSKTEYGGGDVTTVIEYREAPFVIVEDFFDYLKLKQENENELLNFILLNSFANKTKAIEKLSALNPGTVFIKLKNDVLGKAVTNEFFSHYNNAIDLNKTKETIAEIIALREYELERVAEENKYPRHRGFRM